MAPSRMNEKPLGEPAERLAGWFRDLRAPLRRFISRRRFLGAADVDDVAQEVFLRLLRYDRAELVDDPRGYLFKVAANVASEWSMRARERLPHESAWLDDLVDERDAVDDLHVAERDRKLRAALGWLSPRAQQVLRLRFTEDLTNEAIAERLKLTRRIVRRELVEAYARLRLALERDPTERAGVREADAGGPAKEVP